MIIDLPSTTTSHVNSKLVEVREQGGAVALGRVLTLVIVTDDGTKTEEAIAAANEATVDSCQVAGSVVDVTTSVAIPALASLGFLGLDSVSARARAGPA